MVVFSIYRIMTIFLYGLKEETHDSNSEELLTGINGIIKRRRRRRRRRRRIHIAVFRLISPPVCRCFKVAKIGPSVLRLEEGEKNVPINQYQWRHEQGRHAGRNGREATVFLLFFGKERIGMTTGRRAHTSGKTKSTCFAQTVTARPSEHQNNLSLIHIWRCRRWP